MSRSSPHHFPPPSLPRAPHVHPAVAELVTSRRLCKARGLALSVVAQRYGVTVADAHRAEGGVRMLAGVLPHLLREPAAGGRDFRECFRLEAML